MLKQQYDLADTLLTQMDTYTLVILIGNDHYYDIILDKREVVQENFYVLESKLWWIFSERKTIRKLCDENILFLLSTSSDIPSELHKINRENQIAMFKQNVKDLRNLDNIGIKPKENGERGDFSHGLVQWHKRWTFCKLTMEREKWILHSLIKCLEKDPDLLVKNTTTSFEDKLRKV